MNEYRYITTACEDCGLEFTYPYNGMPDMSFELRRYCNVCRSTHKDVYSTDPDFFPYAEPDDFEAIVEQSRCKRKVEHTKLKAPVRIGKSGEKMILVDGKYIVEYRYVMQNILGRPLHTFEQVHHKDCNHFNNHPDNLELWFHHHPSGIRLSDLKCPHCGQPYAPPYQYAGP